MLCHHKGILVQRCCGKTHSRMHISDLRYLGNERRQWSSRKKILLKEKLWSELHFLKTSVITKDLQIPLVPKQSEGFLWQICYWQRNYLLNDKIYCNIVFELERVSTSLRHKGCHILVARRIIALVKSTISGFNCRHTWQEEDSAFRSHATSD